MTPKFLVQGTKIKLTFTKMWKTIRREGDKNKEFCFGPTNFDDILMKQSRVDTKQAVGGKNVKLRGQGWKY